MGGRETERDEAVRQRDRETERKRERQRQRETDRNSQTETEVERERAINTDKIGWQTTEHRSTGNREQLTLESKMK